MTDRAATAVSRAAKDDPRRVALVSGAGDRTFGELQHRCDRLSAALEEGGVEPGDGVALLCSNRPEFVETLYACEQSGLRLTPINWHLGPDEVGYVVGDCEARAVVAESRFGGAVAGEVEAVDPALRLAVGGPVPGFGNYEAALAGAGEGTPRDAPPGVPMLYTSGTTGRPKGVHRDVSQNSAVGAAKLGGYRGGESVALLTGPLYHAAPLVLGLQTAFEAGVGVVMMEAWDAEEFLRLVERHRVTHVHMVPTMFHRLLSLPGDVRASYDVSSLRYVLHGAAPCPVHVKQAMIDWLGPIVHEYYSSTEGGGTSIAAKDWLEHPGSVGRALTTPVEVRDGDGVPCPPGTPGTVWFGRPAEGAFGYYQDEDKTASTYDATREWFSLGDVGYFDEDGFLYLTGRTAEVIISGGVNVYPAEVDAVLLMHEAVGDAACVGVPDDEWGEQVKAVVELKDGHEPSAELERALLFHCREHLAGFKCPRSVDFVDRLPRSDAGKALRAKVREPYWEGRR